MMSEQPTSSDFNPLLALYSIDSEPQSDAKVYDNIAVFEANLKRKNENTKAPVFVIMMLSFDIHALITITQINTKFGAKKI